jgi:hypothetical protein
MLGRFLEFARDGRIADEFLREFNPEFHITR